MDAVVRGPRDAWTPTGRGSQEQLSEPCKKRKTQRKTSRIQPDWEQVPSARGGRGEKAFFGSLSVSLF